MIEDFGRCHRVVFIKGIFQMAGQLVLQQIREESPAKDRTTAFITQDESQR